MITSDRKQKVMQNVQIKIRNNIKRVGCSITGVFDPDGEKPSWTYSIGIPTTIPGGAEIVIYGLSQETAGTIINDLLDQMKNGRVFEAGKEYNDIVGAGLSVYFGRVEKQYYDDHFGQAQIYHGSDDDFPVLQLVWPDPSGKFPWQEGFEERFRETQPLLFDPLKQLIITKEKFLAYEEVRKSGRTNMLDVEMAISLAKGKIIPEDHIEIVKNYSYYKSKYYKQQ